MEKRFLTIAFVITALLLNACTAIKTSDDEIRTKHADIIEKYWKLTEVNGEPINKETNREPHIILKGIDNRVNGTGGCNGFSGHYELKDKNRIAFSNIAITEMACPNMEVEDKMLMVLQTADSYVVKNDTLILNRAKMAPLARFEAVYLQ